MKLSVVIPCYNEVGTIRQIVERVRLSPLENKEIIMIAIKARAPRCGPGLPPRPATSFSCRTPTSNMTRMNTRG
jgi:hypothetical protein